jgi:hypothetical protein
MDSAPAISVVQRSPFPWPTLVWVRLMVAPALIFIATAIDRNYQTDFWHHLARGQEMAAEGRIVNTDLFTFTVPGRPFQDVNWLTQLVYHHLYAWGGLEFVQFVNSLTLATMMLLLVCLCWQQSKSLLLSAGMGVFTFFGLWQILLIRPQTVSLLLFIVMYGVLHLAMKQRRMLLVPPALVVLWSNVHGAFPLGCMLVSAFLMAQVWERRKFKWGILKDRTVLTWSACLAACFLATFVNPYGWNVYDYVRGTSSTATNRGIEEWLPPGLNMLVGAVWVASLMLVMFVFAKARRRPTALDVCLIAVFLPFACSSTRMVAWWLIVSAPVIASLLATMLPNARDRESEPRTPLAAAFFGLLCGLSILCTPGLDRFNPLMGTLRSNHRIESDLAAIARNLRASDGGRVFSRLEWGEYLGWSLAPKCKVFIDGRIEIYPDDVWQKYSAITAARTDWQTILDAYQVNYLVLDRTYHFDLLPQVEQSPDWKPVAEHGAAMLFARQ